MEEFTEKIDIYELLPTVVKDLLLNWLIRGLNEWISPSSFHCDTRTER